MCLLLLLCSSRLSASLAERQAALRFGAVRGLSRSDTRMAVPRMAVSSAGPDANVTLAPPQSAGSQCGR